MLAARAQGQADPGISNPCRFILESSEELSVFVAQLQDYARYEQGRASLVEQQVEAAELIEAALSRCRRAAERADLVIVATVPEELDLRCDATRLRSAWANLVLWAAALTPQGSVLRVKMLRLPDDAVTFAVSTPGDLPDAYAAEGLFAPQLAASGLHGLALPVARRAALLHSGSLTIDSGSGAGITARFSLPPSRAIWPDHAGSPKSRAA